MGGGIDSLWGLAADYTFRTVALGAGLLGVLGGAVGSYAVLRKQSLLGDAVSHAALPGIALAFLLFGARTTPVLLVGAALAGWLGTLLVLGIVRTTRTKEDSAQGLVLAIFFGLGLVLLTFVQRLPGANKAGLDRFLFGQAAALVEQDVLVMGGVGAVVLLAIALFWKEFKLLSFDPDYARSLGLPVRALDIGLTGLLVTAIVLGLQAVGVVLMSALIVAPAAAARQWTDRLWLMVVLAGLFGMVAGISGAVASSTLERLPTGPVIVLSAVGIALFSVLFASRRGVVWAEVHRRLERRRLAVDAVLADLLELARHHDDPAHPHPVKVLRAMNPKPHTVRRNLAALRDRGLAREVPEGWILTGEGHDAARALGGGNPGGREP